MHMNLFDSKVLQPSDLNLKLDQNLKAATQKSMDLKALDSIPGFEGFMEAISPSSRVLELRDNNLSLFKGKKPEIGLMISIWNGFQEDAKTAYLLRNSVA